MNKLFGENVGKTDRMIRIIAGIVLLGLTMTGTIGVWGWGRAICHWLTKHLPSL